MSDSLPGDTEQPDAWAYCAHGNIAGACMWCALLKQALNVYTAAGTGDSGPQPAADQPAPPREMPRLESKAERLWRLHKAMQS